MMVTRLIKNAYKNVWARSTAVILIISATVIGFIYYFHKHPQYLSSLRHISTLQLIEIFGLYIVWMAIIVWLSERIINLCNYKISWRENFLLNSYSTIINFFGPLQSGPIVRGAYLKTKHGLPIKDYSIATIIYYICYAFAGVSLILISLTSVWAVIPVIAVLCLAFLLSKNSIKRKPLKIKNLNISMGAIASLFGVTILQVLLTTLIYYVELKIVRHQASLKHVLAYSGIANLTLFVSLTPAAIGIRESFLLISKKLHHISTPAILAANIVDRGIFIILLIVVLLFIILFHAQKKLQIRSILKPDIT